MFKVHRSIRIINFNINFKWSINILQADIKAALPGIEVKADWSVTEIKALALKETGTFLLMCEHVFCKIEYTCNCNWHLKIYIYINKSCFYNLGTILHLFPKYVECVPTIKIYDPFINFCPNIGFPKVRTHEAPIKFKVKIKLSSNLIFIKFGTKLWEQIVKTEY